MRILFTFENAVGQDAAGGREADAEVFLSTARALAERFPGSRLQVPGPVLPEPGRAGPTAFRAWCPAKPAALRHLGCGLTLPLRRAFRRADLVYTRNLWIALAALRTGRRVVYDHYRPWADQIPPLEPLLRYIARHPRFLAAICHSDLVRGSWERLGAPPDRLARVHNGFDPARVAAMPDRVAARAQLDLPPEAAIALYAGRINPRKGLELLIEAARAAPAILFVLVGSYDPLGPIEILAAGLPNVRIVPFQPDAALAPWLAAADMLVIPPSSAPLSRFGTTVLPLKLFLYLAAGRTIVAGASPDVSELLEDGVTARLCPLDAPRALADALVALAADPAERERLGRAAFDRSRDLTWDARADRIAAVLAARMARPPAAPRPGAPVNRRAWRRRCVRWFWHLLRTRSLVLPPSA